MTADQLTDQLTKASQALNPCQCGSRVIMQYTPGCTFIHCLKENKSVDCLPDWQPDQLKEKWNDEP